MPLHYLLKGWTTGTCRCEGSLGCACWRSSVPCSQFVAYRIDAGNVNGVDVSGLTLIRLIAGDGRQSILYLDAGVTFVQQQAIVAAFAGQLGGRLADLAKLAPIQLPPKLAPIKLSRQQQQAEIAIGRTFCKKNLRAVPFECQHDASH